MKSITAFLIATLFTTSAFALDYITIAPWVFIGEDNHGNPVYVSTKAALMSTGIYGATLRTKLQNKISGLPKATKYQDSLFYDLL